MPLGDVGPMFYALLAAIGLFVFFCFLLVRRTLLAFREGAAERRNR
ncbi:MAG: hypothetical protein ABEJ42_01215 [Halobacteriaceae archaeon]